MRAHRFRKFWRVFRIYFRRFRISVLLVILGLVITLFYLNQIGLPGFLKAPLLEQLRARGIDFQYTRLRLRLFHGIVAEGVRFGQRREPGAPELTARRVELPLNQRALARLEVVPEGLLIQDGRLAWEVPELETNQPPRKIVVENIWTTLDLLTNHHWELNNFSANFLGGKIVVSGTVTNGAALRKWLTAKPRGAAPKAGSAAARLRFWADLLERIEFSEPPNLELRLRGDMLDPKSFSVELRANAPGAKTPWADVTGGFLTARMLPEETNGVALARVRLKAATATTRWASATNLVLNVDLVSRQSETNIVTGTLAFQAVSGQSRWASGSDLKVGAQWTHSLTNPIPLNGRADVQCAFLKTPWGSARAASVEGNFRRLEHPAAPDASLGFWRHFQPYELDWSVAASQLVSTTNRAGELACSGSWRTPVLKLSEVEGRFDGRTLAVTGGLNVATRELSARVDSQADPQRVPMLPPAALRWLSQFTWTNPPVLHADARLVLPSWTNRQPDWQSVVPTIQLSGNFEVDEGGTYRGLEVAAARGRFTYTNQVWHLPLLSARRPEGLLEAEHRANEVTHDFYWKFLSTADPRIIEPWLSEAERETFRLISLGPPPRLTGEVWGRSRHPELAGFRGSVDATNCGFRGETAAVLHASLQFTNGQLGVYEPRIERGTQHLSASGVLVDFNEGLVHITNGFSTAEPQFVGRVIGAHIARILRPYSFAEPPTVRVHGTVPMHGEAGADLYFEVEGGRFSWWKFNLPAIQAMVHWAGTNLALSNMRSQFYGGEAEGAAHFQFRPGGEADFDFDVTVTNAMLQLLMADLTTKTNQLEGSLSGRVSVTHANTSDPQSADGHGSLRLRDGLIWEIPIFGVFSPALNNLSPGLGSSRMGSATCTFQMTNSVLWSEDFEMRAPAMRLAYRGAIDLDGNLDARVEASPLRDMWLVGPVVSTVLWPVSKLFEYKLTGNLDQPKTQPVYIIPKIIQMPFHPFRALRGIFQDKSTSGATGSSLGAGQEPLPRSQD